MSAGIPLASGVAEEAIKDLAKSYEVPYAETSMAALAGLIAADKIPARYQAVNGIAPWEKLYGYIFSEHIKHPNEQRELISRLVGGGEYALNWAHACLGALVEKHFVHTILTTNFDQLALQGVIRTGIVPVVADGLESLNRISPRPKWPQVVHLHGSMHTYELRNSATALSETERDIGLQVMMMSLLKEASVLVVVGYAGGEEGIMTLLQRAADALPRMVVYWVAYEGDFAMLTNRAKAFLRSGENKFFILNQRADEFFNSLVGELGIGAPDWIKNPLQVLKAQAKIKHDQSASSDVALLARAYATRIDYAAEKGTREDTAAELATEKRSARKYLDAAELIETAEAHYCTNTELLRLHASSLYFHYKMKARGVSQYLDRAIDELSTLLKDSGGTNIDDVVMLIEARREQYDLTEAKSSERGTILERIAAHAATAQSGLDSNTDRKNWALMEFYRAETFQLEAERRDEAGEPIHPVGSEKRISLLNDARHAHASALPNLSFTDPVKARECKEGLAGALSGLAESESNLDAASHLREARALFQEVVDSARLNTPDEEYAGALENLATAVRSLSAVDPEEIHNAELEEVRLLGIALQVYEEIEDNGSAVRVRTRLRQ